MASVGIDFGSCGGDRSVSAYVSRECGEWFVRFTDIIPIWGRPNPVHQLTIHYKDGETFHVKHAKDILVVKHGSGGYDVEYVYTKRVNVETDFGEESSVSEISVKTSTHDVIGLTLESRKDQEVYTKEYVGFGG